MASLNKVQLIGNLGKDPESKTLPSGDTVTNFSIATISYDSVVIIIVSCANI